ncbi:MAG: hypothetical protein ACPG77_08485, partial [Nannocystaceae bacterium]
MFLRTHPAFTPAPISGRGKDCIHTLLRLFLLLTAVLATIVASGCGPQAPVEEHPTAEQGLLEIDVGILDSQEPIDLAGTWDLQWETFAVSEATEPAPTPSPTIVPGTWNASNQPQPYPALGYATYRLILQVPSRDDLAVSTPPLHSAYRLFAGPVGGPYKLLVRGGQPGARPELALPLRAPSIAKLPPSQAGKLELVYEISNHSFSHGGIWEAPKLGHAADLQRKRMGLRLRDQFIMGALSLFGLFNMMLIFLRYRER